MSDLIDLLARKRLIWQGRDHQTSSEVSSSGYVDFDEKLSGGLPTSGVVSIESQVGIGELRFLLNTLLAKSRLLVFINPPGFLCAEFFYHQGFDLNNILVIYPRHKNDHLWAAEQCLKSGACSAVLLWQNAFEIHQIKRFQMASEEGRCLQFLMRSNLKNTFSLPVSLSMSFVPSPQGLEVSVSKRKGGWAIPSFHLDMSSHWPALSIDDVVRDRANIIPFPTSTHQQIV